MLGHGKPSECLKFNLSFDQTLKPVVGWGCSAAAADLISKCHHYYGTVFVWLWDIVTKTIFFCLIVPTNTRSDFIVMHSWSCSILIDTADKLGCCSVAAAPRHIIFN